MLMIPHCGPYCNCELYHCFIGWPRRLASPGVRSEIFPSTIRSSSSSQSTRRLRYSITWLVILNSDCFAAVLMSMKRFHRILYQRLTDSYLFAVAEISRCEKILRPYDWKNTNFANVKITKNIVAWHDSDWYLISFTNMSIASQFILPSDCKKESKSLRKESNSIPPKLNYPWRLFKPVLECKTDVMLIMCHK